MMSEIICIGSASKDIFFPTDGGVIIDTPDDVTSQKKMAFELGAKLKVEFVYEAPGGCAANVSQGLSRLGVKALCYANLGNDQTGNWIKNELEKEGVDTALIQMDENCKSDLAAIVVDTATKDHVVFFNRDSSSKLNVVSEKIVSAKWVFVSALHGDWENNLDKIFSVISGKEIKTVFTPGQRNIQDNARKVIEYIGKSDVVILNKDEALEIVENGEGVTDRINDEVFLIEKLIEMGAGLVALTDGERGAWGGDGKNIFHVDAALKADAIDTLGAGDAFASGFVAGILRGMDLMTCLRWGIVNGGNVVRFYGAKEGLLRSDMIEREAQKAEGIIIV